MPRRGEQRVLTNVEKARQYGREHKLSYDAAYHLLFSAMQADGVAARGVDPKAPSEDQLSAEDQADLAAGRAALGGGE